MDKSPAPGSLLSRQGLEKTLSGLISFQSLLEGPLGDLSTAKKVKGCPLHRSHPRPSCHCSSRHLRAPKHLEVPGVTCSPWRCESRALTGLFEQRKAGAEILQQLRAGPHLTPGGITRINRWNVGLQTCLGTCHQVCLTGHGGLWPKVGPDDFGGFFQA